MTEARGQQEKRPFPTRWVVAGIILVLIVIFAIANSARVDVDFVVVDVEEIRLFWVILGSAVIGAILGYLFSMHRRARRN
jgi:uncharacterized integral membrane protein